MAELTLLLRRAKRSNDKKIDLSSRQLEFIPNDLWGLNKLEIVNLSRNRIGSLDQKVKELCNLQVLDLSYNLLTSLPIQLLQLQNLQALILQGNPLNQQFKPLLHENASINIKKTLSQCFGIQSKQADIPSWLQGDSTEMNNNRAFGKMIQIENQYKTQQQKVKQLQKQLQKLTLKSVKSSGKESFHLDPDPILQIDYQQLLIQQQISMGGFSTIHKGQYKDLSVAIKRVFNPKINEELLEQFSNQINLIAKYRHPSIVLLIGICSTPPNLAIVTQYVKNGSLYDMLHKRKTKLTEMNITSIITQIISAVHYLHGHGIVHRDIKSHNFLIDQDLRVKLCDFGLARHRDKLNIGPMQFSGTPVYMAQQLFMKKSYDQSIDVFALGTLLYEVYSGEIPYNGLDAATIKQKIMKDSNLQHHSLRKDIIQIINRCRQPNPSARPTTKQLMDFTFW